MGSKIVIPCFNVLMFRWTEMIICMPLSLIIFNYINDLPNIFDSIVWLLLVAEDTIADSILKYWNYWNSFG